MEENKKFYWLKLKDDFFNQLPMKKLRKIAGGDTYTIIYLKLQLLALKTEGIISVEKTKDDYEFDDFIEDLSITIDEEPFNIKTTIGFCITNKLLESLSENEVFIPSVLSATGKEGASAERVRKFRERQEEQKKALPCNSDVTSSNTEKEKREETREDKRVEVEENKNPKNPDGFRKTQNNDLEVEKIHKAYQNEIGLITPATAERLNDYLNDFDNADLIVEAINRAVANAVRTPNYIYKILDAWNSKGYKTLSDLKSDTKEQITNYNLTSNQISNFEKIWGEYPKQEGKANAQTSYAKWIKGKDINGNIIKLTNDQILNAVIRYADKTKDTDYQYIKRGDVFFDKEIYDYIGE